MVFLYRVSGDLFRVRVSGLAIAASLLALGGCSISIPLPGFVDQEPTGSIKPRTSSLSREIDPKDARVAEHALVAALKAPPTADPAAWSNPETGRQGEFLAIASSFSRGGEFCRAFVARVQDQDAVKSLQAVGCPHEGGEVVLLDVSPWKGL